jgi:hypothetical protein
VVDPEISSRRWPSCWAYCSAGAYLLRKYGSRIGLKAGVVSTDLKVTEWRTLDMRRKLAVVRWGET